MHTYPVMKTHKKELEGRNKSYVAGFDAAINGADSFNCNFSLFCTPETKDSWEAGNSRGKEVILGH